MEIERFDKYRVIISYHRIDDLKIDVTPNGEETIVEALWIGDDDEQFPGEWIFGDAKTGYNLPYRDIKIIEKATSEDYIKMREDSVTKKYSKKSENTNKWYKPLPDSLTVKNSSIEGLGLFSTTSIEKGTNLGITHIKDDRFPNGYSRTPLGGFFNHSETPNCKVEYSDTFITLVTIKDIKEGEELTAKYTFYNPEK